MAVRLKDIAEALGISKVTVSKVLRGAPDVGERTRKLVLDQMKLLDYRPNMHARGLASGRSHAVGLIVPDLIHPFFGEFATALGSALRDSSLALIVASSQEDPSTEQHEVQMLLGRGVDVMVVASCRPKSARGLLFGDERTPYLLVDRYFSSLDAGFVGSPDIEVGQLATQHLIQLGRTRIAHIGGHGMSPAVDRLRGYRLALTQAGLPVESEYILQLKHFEEDGESAGYTAMQQLLSGSPRPDAVFCYNDLSALGAMSAARKARLRIPEDIAFIGCGNLRYAEHFRVPLTSIDHGVDQMGVAAANLAARLANDPADPPRKILIKPELIARRSTVGVAHRRRNANVSKVFAASLLLMLPAHLTAQKLTITPVDLQTANKTEPIGIEQRSLVFGWTLRAQPASARGAHQSAYRILVASSMQKLDRQIGDVWDSGQVTAQAFWQLPYHGAELRSHTRYFWKAQAWSGSAAPGPWSPTAHFTTGILHPSDWTAKWIAAPKSGADLCLPVFRKQVLLSGKVAQALLSVSGLGQYEIRLNGSDVTKTVLNPAWTNYRKTVPYDTYDVTTLLHPGPNAVGVLLGNGMYNVEETPGRYTKFTGSFGALKFILQLQVRYSDGSSRRFVSDASWLTHPGPITFSSIYGGEDFDANILPANWDQPPFEPTAWDPAIEVAGPGGVLNSELSSSMVIGHTYKPVAFSHPQPGITVYDLGENMSGWPEISVHGPSGSRVTLLPGELLAKDGTVSQHSTNADPRHAVLYRYTLAGGAAPEHWHPRFTYHSFRYVQVTMQPAPGGENIPKILDLVGDFVHADTPIIGTFATSNDLFNRIHTLIDRAVLSNLASVMTDCPSREKLGWLEQTYLNAATLMLNYDVTGLYDKMSGDIIEAQLPSGLVPSIAPEYVAFLDAAGNSNAFRDSPEWGSAIILSPWALYQYTGDILPLQAGYAAMQRYVNYLDSRAVAGIIDYGLGDWYDIGPGAPGPSQLTSRKVTATGVYYEDLVSLAKIATLLGHPQDAASYKARADRERELFNKALFHPETGQYDRGSQTAYAIPLALGLVPPGQEQAVLEHLVADIHAHADHVTAGDIGFHYVVRALTDYHRPDVLAAMFSRTDSPSYGYQLAQGATTLTEAWDANPNSSQNHFMLGHGEEWFYRGLAGFALDMARGADDAIALRPSMLAGVEQASATHRTPMGEVRLAWNRIGEGAEVDVAIPAGARAQLLLPTANAWLEGTASATKAAGVINDTSTPEGLQLTLASGSYHFTTAALQLAIQPRN